MNRQHPRADLPADLLEPAISDLLRRVPEMWEAFDVDKLTAIQAQALFLLTGAGMIDRQFSIRMRMFNHPVALEATCTATGEYGAVEALMRRCGLSGNRAIGVGLPVTPSKVRRAIANGSSQRNGGLPIKVSLPAKAWRPTSRHARAYVVSS